MVNVNGIPCINSTGVAVSSANVTYSFDNSREIPFAGLVLVRLQQAVPAGTTGTLPVLFGNVPLTGFNGEPVTAASLSGTGIYIVYYNSRSKLLQLLTGLTPTAAAPTPGA